MKTEEFNKLLEERLVKIKEVLANKSKEYSTDEDRLHNFNKGTLITGESREKVLFGFALKHLVSVIDIIENTNKGIYPSIGMTDEKFGDLINYLILCEISLKENKTLW